jgi:hypothetical protein
VAVDKNLEMHGLELKGLSDVVTGHVLEVLLLGVWHFCGQKRERKTTQEVNRREAVALLMSNNEAAT